jgi:hypothetical protein
MHPVAAPRSIYGVGLSANVRLDALAHLDLAAATDIRLVVGELPAIDGIAGEPQAIFYVSDEDDHGVPSVIASRLPASGHYRFDYADGTCIVIDAGGSRIWAIGPPAATIEDTAAYLLGPALGFALHLRGIACLHASAVDVDGSAVAFVGPAGAGKSTLAAAFARRGHAVLTDDVAALTDLGHRFEIRPAYPRVRLWPASVSLLFGASDALPRLTPTWDKRYLPLEGSYRFAAKPLPLVALVLLGEHDACDSPRLRRLAPASAMMGLVRNGYAARLLDAGQRAHEFDVLGRLAAHVPVHLLEGHGDPARLDRACELVRVHAELALAA